MRAYDKAPTQLRKTVVRTTDRSELESLLLDAEQQAVDVLKAEAWGRAVEGVEKPTGWYGEARIDRRHRMDSIAAE